MLHVAAINPMISFRDCEGRNGPVAARLSAPNCLSETTSDSCILDSGGDRVAHPLLKCAVIVAGEFGWNHDIGAFSAFECSRESGRVRRVATKISAPSPARSATLRTSSHHAYLLSRGEKILSHNRPVWPLAQEQKIQTSNQRVGMRMPAKRASQRWKRMKKPSGALSKRARSSPPPNSRGSELRFSPAASRTFTSTAYAASDLLGRRLVGNDEMKVHFAGLTSSARARSAAILRTQIFVDVVPIECVAPPHFPFLRLRGCGRRAVADTIQGTLMTRPSRGH